MLSNSKIKFLKSLKLKKFRQKYNKFIVEGEKIAEQILRSDKFQIDSIYALDEFQISNKNLLSSFNEKLSIVKPNELERISLLKTPNKVLIVLDIPQKTELEAFKKNALYLDKIQDPGNLGTIIRIADWFNVPDIYCSITSAEVYNPKVIQATMGSFLRTNVHYCHFDEILQKNPGANTYAAVLNGDVVYDKEWGNKNLIVIGNESKGISNEVIEKCKEQITIPKLSDDGDTESLNASVACGIILSHLSMT
jgi:TrmH family RNA methyltransferase